jgi:hypothetical protein
MKRLGLEQRDLVRELRGGWCCWWVFGENEWVVVENNVSSFCLVSAEGILTLWQLIIGNWQSTQCQQKKYFFSQWFPSTPIPFFRWTHASQNIAWNDTSLISQHPLLSRTRFKRSSGSTHNHLCKGADAVSSRQEKYLNQTIADEKWPVHRWYCSVVMRRGG